jgi:signal transduction histidine kinase
MAVRSVSEREVEEGLDQSDRVAGLREIGVSLQGAFDWEALAHQWALALESLGFSAGNVVLYRGPVHRTIRWTRSQGLHRSDRPAGPLVLPDEASNQPADWIVLPLVYQDEFLGYLVLSCDQDDTSVYETLRDQMSTAVKATALMEASLHHQRELESEVDIRTKELRIANRSLTDQIRQRRELEQVVQEVSNRTMQAIGQDIHDDLCQHLAGIGMLASVLEEKWVDHAVEGVGPLREIRNLLDKAVDRARQYSRTLYPPGLEQHGLAAALGDLVDNFGQTAPHLRVALQIEGTQFDAEPHAQLQLYRIAQELIANAVKHSGSELILVRLIDDGTDWTLEVRDFGKGLGDTTASDRMGMRILHFRADSAGARLVFQNLDPGLRVSCRLSQRRGGKR